MTDAAGRLGRGGCARLAETVARVLAPLALTGEVRVRVVDDGEMSGAHERWAGVGGTTDVLTFDLRESGDGPLDTDLLVCADEGLRQAEAHGHTLERELLLYVVHGVLHCAGHDDHDEDDAARMHAEEDRLLSAAGIGATYQPEAAAARPHTMYESEGRVAPAGSCESET